MIWPLKPPVDKTTTPPHELFATVKQAFTPQECNEIIKLSNKFKIHDALLRDAVTREDIVSNQYRKGKVKWLNPEDADTHWVYRKLTDITNRVNDQFWGWELDYIEDLQFTIYDDLNDNYGKHFDHIWDSPGYRKLSFSLQLSDPSLYDGSNLELHMGENTFTGERSMGSMTFFPGFALHTVTPLTRGKRYSLVGWVCGPRFK
jgi:PKHD-type hydroxylase